MGFFDFDQAKDNYDTVNDDEHEGHLSHELVAGGAAFAAMRYFENSQREKGEPVHHQFAKEMLASLAGAEVDKIFETKGLDYIDASRAKSHAAEQATALYDQQYGDQERYDPNTMDPHPTMQ